MNKTLADGSSADRLAFGKLDTADEIMLHQAAAIARLGYFAVNMATRKVEACSKRHAEIFGLLPEQFLERATGVGGTMKMVHPHDRQTVRAGYERLRAGERVEMEYRFKRADGSWGVIVEHIAPEFGDHGVVVRALGASRDVTDTRNREAQALETDRLERLGVLTAGVAHDFNNILAVVMGNAQLGQAHSPSALMQELLDEIVQAAERGARLTKSLLAFAQRATMVPREVCLNELAQEIVSDFDRHKSKDVSLVLNVTKTDPRLEVDGDQLQAVLQNILQNAVEASSAGDEIVISTGVLSSSDAMKHLPGIANGKEFCVVTIHDTGRGIPEANLPRVTEPFFTTKNRAKGSGLGLSMVHGFAQQTGGALRIDSREGEGTTVKLYFPLLGPTQKAPQKLPKGRSAKRVLLLEDDPAVSDVLSRQLETVGYQVMDFCRPGDVLDAVGSGNFDIAILDNILPGPLNGVDVARELRKKGSDLPIILLTGLPTFLSDQHLSYVDGLLHKPVPLETLLKQIETTLGTRR